MEPTPELPPPRPADPEAPSPGDLVVQNGRLSGVRRPLTVPLTLIGRAPSCHVRLNLDGIAELHCAVLAGPTGLVLRVVE